MLRVYNTMSGKKEIFKPIEDKTVRMYVCGPTVYDNAHIGHARSAVVFDVINRWLSYLGYKVIYVRNYTDIDDKIIKRSEERGVPWDQIAKMYIKSYEEDLRALNVEEPTYKPRVTGHIREIIEMVQGLIDKGYAYASDGDVYFSVEKFKDYGKLSKRKIDELLAGARVNISEKKRNPLDFALWKFSKPNEPGWPSPWGRGRPGWHIECSVMAMKYLGETIDIHGGGLDLVFPHHENEIAQSEAFTGKPFAKYWIHNGFVMVNREKMSKSLGNFFTIKQILAKFEPDVLRLFLLSTHYRSPIDFSFEALNDSKRAFEKFTNLLSSRKTIKSLEILNETGEKVDVDLYRKLFLEAMNDDFNTAKAIGILFDLVKKVNVLKDNYVKSNSIPKGSRESILNAIDFIEDSLKLLGFRLKYREISRLDDELIEMLIDVRNELRKRKEFGLSDMIRDRLANLGVIIEDLPSKTIYKRN